MCNQVQDSAVCRLETTTQKLETYRTYAALVLLTSGDYS
jgi:hypothetical protein